MGKEEGLILKLKTIQFREIHTRPNIWLTGGEWAWLTKALANVHVTLHVHCAQIVTHS